MIRLYVKYIQMEWVIEDEMIALAREITRLEKENLEIEGNDFMFKPDYIIQQIKSRIDGSKIEDQTRRVGQNY